MAQTEGLFSEADILKMKKTFTDLREKITTAISDVKNKKIVSRFDMGEVVTKYVTEARLAVDNIFMGCYHDTFTDHIRRIPLQATIPALEHLIILCDEAVKQIEKGEVGQPHL